MAPGLGWLVFFMVVPCLLVLVIAFFERGIYGGVDWAAPTLENFRRAIDPLYLDDLPRQRRVAGAATLIALVIGYPAAYAITLQPPARGKRRSYFSPCCRSGPTI